MCSDVRRQMLLVFEGPDFKTEAFYRPLGRGIEFGETPRKP